MASEQAAAERIRCGERPSAPSGPAWRRRSAVLLVAGLTGLSYAWELNRDPVEPYYAAAVRRCQ